MDHLTRFQMYREIKACLIDNGSYPISGRILGISGIENFYCMIDFDKSELTAVSYPGLWLKNEASS